MIKHVHVVEIRRVGQPSVWYIYAWRGGPRVHRYVGAKRPRLDAATIQAISNAQSARYAIDPTKFRSLIRQWCPSSAEWKRLAPSTQRTWRSHVDRIEEKWGETPLSFWNDTRMISKVVAWRDSRADTARAADIGITVLRTILEFGRLRGLIQANAAAGIGTLYRNGQRADIVWTDEEMERFTARASKMGLPLIADGMRLAALTGLRRTDLVTLIWDEIGEHAIMKRAAKRSAGKRRYATMPIVPALAAFLAELKTRIRREGVETVLVNSLGKSWSVMGFGGSFNRVRDAAEIYHIDADTGERNAKHLHDIRGTFCTKLLTETDLSDREVAEIMGWSPDRVSGIRRVYVDQSQAIIALGKRLGQFGEVKQSMA